MNIYKHELKAYLKNTIMWICVLSGIAIIFMLMYPALKSDMDNFVKIMDNFPPEMKAIFGLVVDNFTSPIGFYGFVFTYVTLFGAIQAMNLGIGIISKEEREKTADFLMTKPVSRTTILTAKIVAVFTLLFITNVIYTALSGFVVSELSEQNFEMKIFALMNVSMLFTQIIFFSIGFIVSILAKKIKSILPVSLGLVFMFYAISALVVTSKEDKLRFITPFQYFKMDYIIAKGQFETVYAFTGLFIVAASIVLGYIMYNHKDVHAV